MKDRLKQESQSGFAPQHPVPKQFPAVLAIILLLFLRLSLGEDQPWAAAVVLVGLAQTSVSGANLEHCPAWAS